MTVRELIDALSLKPLVLADESREVTGGYAGDLLSWVMGRAQADEAWVTIMSNNNIVAVASLADVSCIVLAEGVQPDAGVAETAKARNVNVLSSEEGTFDVCGRIRDLLK